MNGRAYTEQDIEFILQNKDSMSFKQLAEALNRSIASLETYFKRNGIKKKKQPLPKAIDKNKKFRIKKYLKSNLGQPLRIAAEKYDVNIGSISKLWEQAYNETLKKAA